MNTKNLVIYDLEVYRNYFLAGLLTPDGTVTQFTERESLLRALGFMKYDGYELCGFNSKRYDDPVMHAFLEHGSPLEAYEKSKEIIEGDNYGWHPRDIDAIDLMPLLPGRMSLKQIGIRLHHKRLQELPIDPHKELTVEEMEIIRLYNINDLEITQKLLHEIQPELDLRGSLSDTYGIDLRSLGDATIAEKVIHSEISTNTPGGVTLKDMKALASNNATYALVTAPNWFSMLDNNPNLGTEVRRIVDICRPRFNRPIPLDYNGRLKLPAEDPIYLGDKFYKVGVGGLHSVDGPGSYVAGDGGLVDIDVVSYYPRIILNEKLFPRHIADLFGAVFNTLVERRLEAKAAGNKVAQDRLKITINGTFGKTSDPYSALYDPQITAGTTIIGQVSLLVLIAALVDGGIRVVSANTDGITALHKAGEMGTLQSIVQWWEKMTSFTMEYTDYRSIFYRDVNNYVAVKDDGSLKSKGIFATKETGVDLRHALKGNIIPESVKVSLQDGSCPLKTIIACRDINKFLLTHAATGKRKCVWWGEELGKLVRFYKADGSGKMPNSIEIKDPDTGRKSTVPQSDRSVPLMDLPSEWPTDIDHEWYFEEAIELRDKVRLPKKCGWNELASHYYKLGYIPTVVKRDRAARRSRAWSVIGETDFNSMDVRTEELGICTGPKAGVVAVLDYGTKETKEIYKFDGQLPASTRALIGKHEGIVIIYGGNVPAPYEVMTEPQELPDELLDQWRSDYYTPAELKRVEKKAPF